MTVLTKKHLTIVIKLGTSSIVDEKTHEPLLSILSTIVETAVKLTHEGHRVVIVSSGAIGVGLRRMDIEKRPKKPLERLQALAAIGQCRLIRLWDELFAHLRQPVAQILLTRNDIADRTQYLNAQNTFRELLDMGVIPIVNENDTLAVSEIKFGDNDTLSAITAGMVHADYLFLMTDVDCLYDKNPRTNPDAKAIEVVEDISELAADVSSAGSSLGTGGMSTKIVAARLATSAGVTTVITRSSKPGNIHAIVEYAEAQKAAHVSSDRPSAQDSVAATLDGLVYQQISALNLEDSTAAISSPGPESADYSPINPSALAEPLPLPPLHTRFLPDPHPIRDRRFWLLHGLAPHGTLYIDEGAHKALADKAGLLPVGIVDVEGSFAQQEAVRLVVVKRPPISSTPSANNIQAAMPTSSSNLARSTSSTNLVRNTSSSNLALASGAVTPSTSFNGVEIGRALVNYSSTEIKRIRGLRSSEIRSVLDYADSEYVALRENIAFSNYGQSRPATPALV